MADKLWTPDLTGRNPVRYLALVEALAEAIERGQLRPGQRLPTHRELAWQLQVNVSTVSHAYREATRRHLISGEVGRGTFVLASSREAALFALKAAEPAADGPPALIDLSTNLPAADPDDHDLAHSLASLAGEGCLGPAALGYHAPALLERARLAGTAWLAGRGLVLRPAEVVPCAGSQAALLAVLLTLCPPGEPVLVEALTFPGIKAVARQLRLPLHGVPLDHQGVIPEELDRAARATGARVAVLVPTLHNPTGAMMGEERRRAVAEVARRQGLWLVEDDVYAPLLNQPPLAALVPERGIVITSLSKTVAAGLRFGLIAGACPPVQTLAGELHATAWPLAPLMLELTCRWLEDGTAARRLAWQQAEVAARHALARRVLAGCGIRPGPPCPHLWLPLSADSPAGDSQAVAARCRAAGVEGVAAPVFATSRAAPEGLRLSLAAARSRAELSEALARLSRAIG